MKKYKFFLIKPSLYDDEGFVIRFSKGVLPSNTLTVLNGLLDYYLKKLKEELNFEYEIEIYDEIVDKINLKKFRKKIKNIGVQSNQFSRATDLAVEFRKNGFLVFVGGFHVSGILSVFGKPDESLQKLIDNNIYLVAGEVEDSLEIILKDILNNSIKSIYNFLSLKPDLNHPIMPKIPQNYLKKFALPNFSTLDCGRGCPYRCSFCTIIQVHGNMMRYRNVDLIKNYIIENYKANKVDYYFFTDDNFARNKNWKEILLALIEIKKHYSIKLRFMIQVDTLAYKIPEFVHLLKEAGCTQVFVGMESLNPENLKAAAKRQNKVENFYEMVQTWNKAGIIVHTGYILGFPFDTSQSLLKDIQMLSDELRVQQASFFILTPLPGSMDHKTMLEKGLIFDFDFNHYDSFHLVWKHPHFDPNTMKEFYLFAWKYFYSFRNLIKRIYHSAQYSIQMTSNLLGTYLWYKYSIVVNKHHPMISGFHRKKSYFERRSSIKVFLKELLWFYTKRVLEIFLEIIYTSKIVLEWLILWFIYISLKTKISFKNLFAYNKNQLVIEYQKT